MSRFANCSGQGTYKVYSNSRNVGLRVGIVRKSKEQARLSDTGVSNEEELEQVIADKVI
jgi:hypothetical protein